MKDKKKFVVIEERRALPEGVAGMSIFWRGDGDPSSVHILLGMAFYDECGEPLWRLGETDLEADEVHIVEDGHVR